MYTKSELVKGFFEIYTRYGFKSITVDDLAQKFGLSKKTLYSIFESKDDIVAAVTQYFTDNLRVILNDSIQIKGDVLDKIITNHINFIRYVYRINPIFYITLKKYYYNNYQTLVKFSDNEHFNKLKQLIYDGIEDDIFRKDIPVESILHIHLNHVGLFIFEDKPTEFAPELDSKTLFFILINDIRGMTTPKGYQLLDSKLQHFNDLF